MNLKTVGTLCVYVGVVIVPFAGSAIARRAGFDAESWLMEVTCPSNFGPGES